MQHSGENTPVQTILEYVAGIKIKMSEYLQDTIKFISVNIAYLVFVVFQYNMGQQGFCFCFCFLGHCIVFIYVLHNVPTLLELGFVKLHIEL